MNDGLKSTAAIALVGGGIASAFALAACCAVPILLAGIGIGAAGLAPIVAATQPHSTLITALSVLGLAGGAGVVARAPKHCDPGSVCARPWFRWSIIAAAVVGGALLVLSKIYA